jgi:uncharacterized protein YkwD
VPEADQPAHHASAQRAPVPHRSRADWDRIERGVHRALNRARARRGLPRLRLAPAISWVAASHSHDLLRHGFLSHTSSNGTSFHSRIRSVTRARTVGETVVAMRGRVTGRAVVRAWLRSPSHRAEVLGGYRRVGVGRATRGGLTIVTADFATGR